MLETITTIGENSTYEPYLNLLHTVSSKVLTLASTSLTDTLRTTFTVANV